MLRRASFLASGQPWLLTLLLCQVLIASLRADEGQSWLSDNDLVNGRHFRHAFRSIVEMPSSWTVNILSEGKRVALGTIVGSDGWILTKASQSIKANRIELKDGRQFPFTSKAYRQDLDLALLKIDVAELTQAKWELTEPKLGAWMLTVGTASDPVAVGAMSVSRRKIPRLNVHGYLGVELDRDNLPKIKRVFPNSGASEAGLQAGDLVLEVDHQAIASGQQLVRALHNYRPGDTLALTIRRSEEKLAYAVTLMHPYGDFLSRMAFQNQMGGPLSFRRDDFEQAYQHDSVITPQECGGTVVNLDGRAVGLNIARAGRTETYALPADLVVPIIEEMKAGRYPPPATTQLPGRILNIGTTGE